MPMRQLIIAMAFLPAACASIDTVKKTPDSDDVAALLVDDLACRNTAEKECMPGDQPKSVDFASIHCEALPLRPATRESAHAVCVFEGTLTRVDGVATPIASSRREFSLIELTPGVRVPERAWTIMPLEPASKR